MEDDKVILSPIELMPFKGKYMKIKRGEQVLILDPNKYDISSLMMLLDISKLNKLESQFKKHPNGIEKDQFIHLMVNELPKDNDDLINLVYGLYKLFLEIDFNGDEKMQWEEFTQFIIDSVMGENDTKGGDDDDDLTGGGKESSEKHMIKYKRYNVSTVTEDKTLHDTDIVDSVFSPKIDKIFVVEYKSKKIKMYNPRTGRIDNFFDLDNYFKVPSKDTSLDTALDDNDKKKGIEKKKKPKKEVKQQLTFSVLSFCMSPGNILAICTTNKKILFFEFTPDGKEEFRYEITTQLLQKRVWFLPDHNVWLSTGMKKEEEKIFHLHELDIEFEYKNSKLEILTNIGTKIDERNIHTNPFRGSIGDHTDEILDAIEIKKPMLVLTACMDKIIRLINLNDREIVEVWADQHKSAVRALDYNANVGVGLILSVGFEYYINVWSPEVALNDAFKGKLEGHYSPVIMCKFLSGSPMCVSVDEEGNVRIWDSRQLLCLQLIPQEKKNFKVSKLLNMHKHNRFVLYGNKMVFYDPKYRDSDIKPKNHKVDENYPIRVEFNKYYMTFYVCTMKDVRIYSSRTGELIKVFKNLRSNTNDPESKIKFFAFEDRHRKFYLGFSHGAIQLFNAGNGSLIKRIGEYEEEKEGITQQRYDHSSEISNIFYEEENMILITTALDSLINVYDESNPEEATKLRTLKGGHKIQERNNQIICFDFSRHLNLFATGSSDGLVTLWDFELSKVVEVLYLRNVDKDKVYDVLSLKFLAPYPILASTYSDGSVYLWGVRPNYKYNGECFMRFRNSYLINNKIEHIAITSSMYLHGEMEEITINKRDYPIPKKEKVVSEVPQTQKVEDKVEKQKNQGKSFNKRNVEVVKEEKKEIVIEPEQEVTEIEFEDEKYDLELDRNRFDVLPSKSYFIIGDQKGLVRIYDIKPIVKKFNFEEAAQAHITSKFNILKKDDINVEAIVNYHLQRETRLGIPKFLNINPFLLIKEYQAHEDQILQLNLIKDPFSFITCSKDKKFKIWTIQGDCIGEVNVGATILNNDLKNTCEWKFKIDWEKLKLEEMAEVLRIYSNVNIYSSSNDDGNMGENLITDENIDERGKKKDNKQETQIIKKKRYKPLEEAKKDKIFISYNDDADVKFDDQYIQELSKKIHRVVNPLPYESGLYEMGKHLFDNAFKKEKDKDLSENFNYISPSMGNHYSNHRINKDKKPPSKMKVKEKEKNPAEKGVKYSAVERDQLQSEKYFKNLSGVCKKRGDEFLLPLINDKKNQNIKFKKGETERYLAFEFYRNSYNNCFEPRGKDISNESLRKNYLTMWKYVKEYGKNSSDYLK